MACISAKTGTLVFASINFVAATLSSALGIGFFIYLALSFLVVDYRPRSLIDLNDMVRDMFICLLWIAFWILGLVLASFLLNGILKKKAEHIKAYFVYGTVIVFLVINILYSYYHFRLYNRGPLGFYEPQQPEIVAALLSLLFYSLILYMIRITYKNIEADKIQFDHKPLVEKSELHL